jgi:ACS family tartrate transporter-like MFS transporter
MAHTAANSTRPHAAADAGLTGVQESAIRKAAWRLVPVLALGYFFAYLDRTSVGFAALTMNHDIGLTASQFGYGAGLMFVAYCLCEVPSNLAMYRFGARRWIARILITWGIAAAATALAVGPKSFYLVRLLLGVGEAGFFPGVIFYLTLWFPAHYRTRVLAWFTVGTPISSLVGGPVSVWLLHQNGVFGLAGWQWMFIAEGLPACLLGFWVLHVLADSPKRAAWLTPAERDGLQTLLDSERVSSTKSESFLPALRDPRVYILASISFSFSLGSYGVAIWLPQILKSHGLGLTATGWLSAVPYFFATIGLLLWAGHVDRTGKRISNLAYSCLLGVLFDSLGPALVGITLALVGTISARTIFFTIPARFLDGQAAAGGIAVINAIGAFGGFVGPYLMGVLKERTGSFSAGMLAMAAILFAATLLSASILFFMPDE